MGYTRKWTQAEWRQFENDQRNPAFQSWLSGMDDAIVTFMTDDAPEVGKLENPWGRDGLVAVTGVLRARFPDPDSIDAPENAQVLDRFVRVIGEAFRRSLEGRWVNVVDNAPRGAAEFWPEVDVPAHNFVDPNAQLGGAFRRRPDRPDGDLVWVYGNAERDYREWVEHGRPDRDTWWDLRHQLWRERAGNGAP
ncbi:hypothetical protein IU510_12880 [Nocardia cyriacigeorgica]|uniref:hypothetical protein n=1 Tax=Nocardia cyriacigeorgica TaxID=135487 RepID=UPI001895E0F6|nr:hypothetical protein [Nocardia cyriacigeorgica]MBF6098972.1 hypothetical protein [Nocardia cyriacigeorgica]MBF6159472.1 hypothetical protein [Nocardia cyriacigeorgica]MBF6198555.1 hypothetical protein [Nocardia cyriacigeorgica]MBF6515010.1 hypothetical protein [Nocardia cyriacigeorgica]